MPLTITNTATAADESLVAVLGFMALFRKDEQAGFHDFGHVLSPAREQDLTELEVKSARLGKLATVKKLTTEASLEYTFQTQSVLDQETVALHTGGAVEAGAIGTGGFVSAEDFTGTTGELLLIQRNAEASGKIKIAYYPSVTLKGDGEESGDGENAATLTFRATVTPDEDFTVAAALAAGEPEAPYGFRYVCAPADLDDVLDAIADGGPNATP